MFSQPAIQWQKCLGGSGDDGAYSIEQTTDYGYIIAGTTNSNDGNVSGNHGTMPSPDFWIVKLAPDNVGIDETKEQGRISIYPNPASGTITVKS